MFVLVMKLSSITYLTFWSIKNPLSSNCVLKLYSYNFKSWLTLKHKITQEKLIGLVYQLFAVSEQLCKRNRYFFSLKELDTIFVQ